MPRNLALQSLSGLQKLSHDPTVQIQGDPLGILGDNPFGEMTEAIIFGAVNSLLTMIDDVTGLDLMGLVGPLEALLGTSTGLLSGFLGFLTPGASTAGGGVFGPLLGLIPGLAGGTGTLGGFGSFLQPTSFLGSAAGIFGPLLSGGTLLGGLVPGLDASKIISGQFGLSQIAGLLSGGFINTSLLSVPTSALVGLLSLIQIPGLPGSQITSGTIGSGFIPGLDASKIVSGQFGLSQIAGLLSGGFINTSLLSVPTSALTGLLSLIQIPGLPGSQITSGTIGSGFIPGLDASKIISGLFPLTQVAGLPNMNTNLLSLLGVDFSVGTGLFNPAASFLVPVEHFVQQFTGTSGGLPDLGAWAGDRPSLPNLLSALGGSGGSLFDLTSWANTLTPLSSHNALLGVLQGGFGSIESRFASFLTPGSNISGSNITGTIADTVNPFNSILRDLLHGVFSGQNVSGATTSDVQTALEATNATLQGVSAAMSRFNTVLTSGVSAIDLLERSTNSDGSEGLGTPWGTPIYSTGPGVVYLDGHNAVWKPGTLTATPRDMRVRYTATPHSNDIYQRVEIQLASAPDHPVLFGSTPGGDSVLLRCNDAMTDYIEFYFRGDSVVLVSYVVSNAKTALGSVSLPSALGSNSSIGGIAGKNGTARFYLPLFNGFPVGTGILESGTASGASAAHHGWGMGMHAGSNNTLILGLAQSLPGSVKQFAGSDYIYTP